MLKVKYTKAYIVEVLDDDGNMLEQRIIETDHKQFAEMHGREMKADWNDIMAERKRLRIG